MGMKRIMLACAAGMSTSMLVARMQKAAQEKGLYTEIFAVPASEARSRIEQEPVDVLLLGPQVMYMEAEFKKKLESKGIPVGVIPMMDYGMMNGAKVLDFAENLVRGQ